MLTRPERGLGVEERVGRFERAMIQFCPRCAAHPARDAPPGGVAPATAPARNPVECLLCV